MEQNPEEVEPKKRGRKVGSKNKNKTNVENVPEKPPPKKRGRKPKENIIKNENPVFNSNTNSENLIIRLMFVLRAGIVVIVLKIILLEYLLNIQIIYSIFMVIFVH